MARALHPTRIRKHEGSREPNPRGWDMFMEYRSVYGEERIMNNTPVVDINLVSIDTLEFNGYGFYYREADKEVVIERRREILGKGYNKCGLYRLSINNEWLDANIIEELD
nr:hypothetical protein [Tanacetum cinerariifolium]